MNKNILPLLLCLLGISYSNICHADSLIDETKYVGCMNIIHGEGAAKLATDIGRWQIFYDETRRSNGQQTLYIYDKFNKEGSVREITEDGACISKRTSDKVTHGNSIPIGSRSDIIKRNFDDFFSNARIKNTKSFYKRVMSECPTSVTDEDFQKKLSHFLNLSPEDVKVGKAKSPVKEENTPDNR
jgi:hypothetical protein